MQNEFIHKRALQKYGTEINIKLIGFKEKIYFCRKIRLDYFMFDQGIELFLII